MADAGLSHVPDFRDPTARVFLNDKGKQSLAKIELAIRARRFQLLHARDWQQGNPDI